MSTFKIFALCGSLFLGAAGCGVLSPAVDSASITSVAANEVAGGQLAVPEGENRLADDAPGQHGRPDCKNLTDLLGLSADQAAQVQAIEQATRDALALLRQQVKGGQLTGEEAHTQGQALRDAEKAQILALLTAEQQAKFTALRAEHGRSFDLARLTALLGLSDAQVAQITALLTDTQAKVRDLRSQVEAGTITAEDGRAQIKDLLDAQLAAIKGALTAEQVAKLDAGRLGHDGDGRGPGGGAHDAPPPGRR